MTRSELSKYTDLHIEELSDKELLTLIKKLSEDLSSDPGFCKLMNEAMKRDLINFGVDVSRRNDERRSI